MSGVLGAYADRRTWEVAAYLLLGLPLGVLGFVLLVTGFSLGLGLLVTLLGIPVLVVTILLARTLASFERRLASTLLEAPLPLGGGRIPDEPDRGLWRRLRAMFSIVFLAVGPWLIRRWGRVPAWVATTMLGRLEQRELKRAVVHTLERTGEADGFSCWTSSSSSSVEAGPVPHRDPRPGSAAGPGVDRAGGRAPRCVAHALCAGLDG